jgi:sRNA-binding regulator protein Hfq
MEQPITNEASFFNALISGGGASQIYTITGIKLTGTVVSADDHCIFLRGGADGKGTTISLIMKNAISTIVPLVRTDTKPNLAGNRHKSNPATIDYA